jgi:hypothetical protein
VCDDNDVCNGIETCDPNTGGCLAGTPLDCDDSEDCTEDSCDPNTGCSNTPIDEDNDGFSICDDADCDDSDPNINPDAVEIYDGKDNNCDGQVDEHCYFEVDLFTEGESGYTLWATFGLDANQDAGGDPDNWSDDGTVRLQLLDASAVETDPNNLYLSG